MRFLFNRRKPTMVTPDEAVAGRDRPAFTLPGRHAVLGTPLRPPFPDRLNTAAGHPNLRWPLPPSTSPEEPEFHPRSYWRGPVWPVMNWLLWWSLVKAGEKERAIRLRNHGLAQLSDGRFGEYYEPFTGEPLGSDEQSWTAAVVLDWLANQEEVSAKP